MQIVALLFLVLTPLAASANMKADFKIIYPDHETKTFEFIQSDSTTAIIPIRDTRITCSALFLEKGGTIDLGCGVFGTHSYFSVPMDCMRKADALMMINSRSVDGKDIEITLVSGVCTKLRKK